MYAFLLFFFTILFVIIRPFNLKIGNIALFGALVAVVSGLVGIGDVVKIVKIVWDATFAFIGIVIISLIFDEIGFFEYCAILVAKASKSNGKLMFVYSMLLGSLVSALFANDGAALIFTPILLSKMKMLKVDKRILVAFMLAGGFISDSASLPFVFSNLTNIITADFFHIGFIEYFLHMFFPFVISVVVTIVVSYWYFRKDIPDYIDISGLKKPSEVIKSKFLFNFGIFFLAVLLVGYVISDIYKIPISFFALGGALFFLMVAYLKREVSPKKILKDTPWQIIWFSLGLFVVVYGLKNAGFTSYIKEWVMCAKHFGNGFSVVFTGLLSGALSALMNNLPSVMLMDIAMKHMDHIYAFANIIGSNIGPKMTPFGSLATLMWLHVLEKEGVKISMKEFFKYGLFITPIVLVTVLLAL